MILITGANGQLGQCLKAVSSHESNIFLNKEQCDITDFHQLEDNILKYQPTHIINTAAYTTVDKAEEEKDLAFLINAEGPRNLALLCKKYGIKLIHISTDYVFNGKNNLPYSETDHANPINTYGQSKYEGEKNILAINPDSMIIRTSWLYSEYKSNFVTNMIKHIQNRRELGIVFDQVGSPTYAGGLATAILEIISLDQFYSGIYHYCDNGVASWYDLTLEIRNFLKSDLEIAAITTEKYPTPAARPNYSVLNNQKINSLLSTKIVWWKDNLKIALMRLITQS